MKLISSASLGFTLVKDPNHQAVIKRLPKWLPKKAAPEFKLKSERLRLRKK